MTCFPLLLIQWESTKNANLDKKVPNCWNLVSLSELGSSATTDQAGYLQKVADWNVSTDTCRDYLAHFNDNRDLVEQQLLLDDQQKEDVNNVLDEFNDSL